MELNFLKNCLHCVHQACGILQTRLASRHALVSCSKEHSNFVIKHFETELNLKVLFNYV